MEMDDKMSTASVKSTARASQNAVKIKIEKSFAGRREAALVTQMSNVNIDVNWGEEMKPVFSTNELETLSEQTGNSEFKRRGSSGCQESGNNEHMNRESSENCQNPIGHVTPKRNLRPRTPSGNNEHMNRESSESYLNRIGDVTPKRSLRPRTPVKNLIPKIENGFENGEREWSAENKRQLISIFERDGYDGDPNKLKLENRSNESVRYLIDDCEKKRKKKNWELMLDSEIDQLRGMEGAALTENLPLFLELLSLLGKHPDPSQVGGIDYSAIYAYLASLMLGEVPKQLNCITRMKFSQVFNQFKTRILAEPEVPFTEFKTETRTVFEKRKGLKERREKEWSKEELEAREILVSGNLNLIREFYLSHASLNPF